MRQAACCLSCQPCCAMLCSAQPAHTRLASNPTCPAVQVSALRCTCQCVLCRCSASRNSRQRDWESLLAASRAVSRHTNTSRGSLVQRSPMPHIPLVCVQAKVQGGCCKPACSLRANSGVLTHGLKVGGDQTSLVGQTHHTCARPGARRRRGSHRLTQNRATHTIEPSIKLSS